jgi:hypothetical protein
LDKDPATGLAAVKHVANLQSGGHISFVDIASFLSSGNGPEHQALRQLATTEKLATILIAYDVHPTSDSRYHELADAIQTLGPWWHHLETVWVVRSDKTPEELRDWLQAFVGRDDQLLIVDITGVRAGWRGINEAGSVWLRESIGWKSADDAGGPAVAPEAHR